MLVVEAHEYTQVTQPRRVAAVSTATRVAKELGLTFGKEVAYQASDIRVNDVGPSRPGVAGALRGQCKEIHQGQVHDRWDSAQRNPTGLALIYAARFELRPC